jgi:hypothetical protein
MWATIKQGVVLTGMEGEEWDAGIPYREIPVREVVPLPLLRQWFVSYIEVVELQPQ